AKAMGADGHAVMRLVCEDTKLNISPAYMRPGFAFGGSCLPKDLRAINRFAEHAALRLNLLPSVMASNENQLKRALKMVRDEGSRKIGLVGLSFKNGTDDLRESPMVEMVETLTGWGYSVKIYDPNVSLGRLRGRNLSYIDRHLPHLAQMLVSEPEEVLEHAELLLLCTDVANAHDWRGQAKGRVFDLRTDLARPVEPAPEAPRQRDVAAARAAAHRPVPPCAPPERGRAGIRPGDSGAGTGSWPQAVKRLRPHRSPSRVDARRIRASPPGGGLLPRGAGSTSRRLPGRTAMRAAPGRPPVRSGTSWRGIADVRREQAAPDAGRSRINRRG